MEIDYKILNDQIVTGTTSGLSKLTNEDVIGCTRVNNKSIICLTDGHWGDHAAIYANDHILKAEFPDTRKEAIELISNIEKSLWLDLGNPVMSPIHDFTPETSLLAVEIDQTKVNIISYGDCRLMVARRDQIIYQIKTKPTWLGAFSYLGLRKRDSVDEGLIYDSINCQPGDILMLYTDGIDECVYGVPTLSPEWIADQLNKPLSLKLIAENIFREVEKNGAEDNASLVIVRI